MWVKETEKGLMKTTQKKVYNQSKEQEGKKRNIAPNCNIIKRHGRK
jgi:hypothetical protein